MGGDTNLDGCRRVAACCRRTRDHVACSERNGSRVIRMKRVDRLPDFSEPRAWSISVVRNPPKYGATIQKLQFINEVSAFRCLCEGQQRYFAPVCLQDRIDGHVAELNPAKLARLRNKFQRLWDP